MFWKIIVDATNVDCSSLSSIYTLFKTPKSSEIVYPVHDPENHTLFNDTHQSRPNKGAPHLPFSGENDNWINESFVVSNFVVVLILPQQLR